MSVSYTNMSYYRIVCTEQTNCSSRGHIVGVGTGNDAGKANMSWTVAEVYAAMRNGHIFFTQDHAGNVAFVNSYNCGCGRGSLRSTPDHTTANNLDNLRLCSWR